MEMFGDTEGRNVGEYITQIRPTDNYEWAGGAALDGGKKA